MRQAFGHEIPERLEEVLERSALLVWDMQHAIADQVSNRTQIISAVRLLCQAAHEAGVPVLYSQHYSPPLAAEDVAWLRAQWRRSGAADPSRLSPLAPPGSPGWRLLDEVAPQDGDIIVAKTRPSLFVGTPARDILAGLGVHSLVVTGVTTDRGVFGTALHAGHVGLMPVVASDAVGSYTAEAHARGLEHLADIADLAPARHIASCWAKAAR